MNTFKWFWIVLITIALFESSIVFGQERYRTVLDAPWERHTIDDSSLGSDGTKFSDVNNDGKLDLITGWEEGGISRIYLQPDNNKSILHIRRGQGYIWPLFFGIIRL